MVTAKRQCTPPVRPTKGVPPQEDEMSDDVEQFAKKNGFVSADEMRRMVCAVDLSTLGRVRQYEAWKRDDGSKSGLEKLLSE